MDLQALQANYQPMQFAAAPEKKKGPGGARGALLNFLPTVLGGAGAVLGGAAGSVVAPIAGTAAGAAGGGAIGSGLGEYLRQKLTGEAEDGVDVGNIATEAGFGALPGVGKAVTAAKAARAANGARGAIQAAEAASAPVMRGVEELTGTAAQAPRVLQGSVRGIPVKSIDSVATGSGVPVRVNNTLTDANIGGLQGAIQSMTDQGYGVSSKVGKLASQSAGAPKSVVSLTGTKTQVPLTTAGESTSIIPAKTATTAATPSFTPQTTRATTTTAAPQTTEAALMQRQGMAQKVGAAATQAGSGLKVGKGVGDVSNLDDLTQVAAKYTGTPKQQLRKIESDMGSMSDQVDEILKTTNVRVDGKAVGERLKRAATDLTDERFVDLDLANPSVQNIITRYSDKFGQAGDAKGVNDVVKTLNKTAARANDKLANPGAAPLTAQETAALALKRAGDDVLSEIPEIAPYKKQMAQLFDINPQVAMEAEKGFSVPFVGGTKVKAPYQAMRGAQSVVGAKLQGMAGGDIVHAGAIPQPVKDVAKASLPQAGYRAAGSALTGNPYAGDPPAEDPAAAAPAAASQYPAPAALPAASNSPFSNDNIEKNVQAILANGGGAKDVQEYLGIAKAMQEFAPKPGKPMSAETSKVVANAQSGLDSLDHLERVIGENGGVSMGTLVPGRGMFGNAGANLLGTADYDTAAKNLTDVITRLRSGAAITADEDARYKSMIPQAFDSPDVRQQKLQIFRDLFQRVANQTGSAGSDMQAAAGA